MSTPSSETHFLSGFESQKLRTFCTSRSWVASDLDDFAHMLMQGSLSDVQAYFNERVAKFGTEVVRTALAAKAYGPIKIPLYNLLLQFMFLNPAGRKQYLSIIRWLAEEAKVPVDSTDLSGTSAFMWAISTKPYLELEFAEILFAAGADINRQNRYGCVAAAEFCMVRDFSPKGQRDARRALRYFLARGGNCDIADGDRVTPRGIIEKVKPRMPRMAVILQEHSVTSVPDTVPEITTILLPGLSTP